jgi:hypothetical protein
MSKPVTATPVVPIVLFVAALLFSALPAASVRAVPMPSVPADTGDVRARKEIKVLGTPVEMPPIADAREVATELALDAFSGIARQTSHPDALRIAFRAYYSHRAAHPEEVANPYMYFVDFGLDNATPRGWVFDMARLALVDGPFPVAHGRGSLDDRDGVPNSFSNRPGSYQSSLGLYVAEETYTFRGTAGGRRYSSIGLRMRGESGAFNDAALRRGIVAHGAPYVTASAAGRSEGCPAMEQHRARRLLPLLANGGIIFIYSPNDIGWLSQDPWVNAD